jgi:hypothetical protein
MLPRSAKLTAKALRENPPSTGGAYQFVNAYPNYPHTGLILLYESVSNPSYIKMVERIGKSAEGVDAVQTDLRVQR